MIAFFCAEVVLLSNFPSVMRCVGLVRLSGKDCEMGGWK